jgi:K+-transporting ATPase KdpF subunit
VLIVNVICAVLSVAALGYLMFALLHPDRL